MRLLLICLLVLFAAGCDLLTSRPPGLGDTIEWEELPGWEQDHHAEAWPALLNGCVKLAAKPRWAATCQAAHNLAEPSHQQAKAFFEHYFQPHPLYGQREKRSGLITGYYEPLLHGSMVPSERFRYPIYAPPQDLLIVDLGSLYADLEGKRVRGRLQGNRVTPYYSREEIDAADQPLKGNEIVWVDDPNALFFLQVQGSGRVRLPDGKIIGVGYAEQNGHPYISVGKRMVQQGLLKQAEVTLFTIRDWLRAHPTQAKRLLNQNPSYVFFVLRDDPGNGPIGSLNVPLTAERSIAIDPKVVALGSPVWLDTHYPAEQDDDQGNDVGNDLNDDASPFRKLVFAQDTGGAIKGLLRADIFFGHGERAEQLAGRMKHPGKFYILVPKGDPPELAVKR